MTEEKSLDVGGLGKIAQSIPESSWNKLVNTACDTFSQLLAPITATSYGLGQLIQAKFDGMVDAQKVLAADTVARAKNKVEKSNQKITGNPKAVIIVNAIEFSSNESDENIREIWANIIANEIITNDIHPEILNLLRRLSHEDTAILAEIGQANDKDVVKTAVKSVIFSLEIMGFSISSFTNADTDFNHEHLTNLRLIEKYSGAWYLTLMGEQFLTTVSDPTFSEQIPT